jgi:hypothetical protein
MEISVCTSTHSRFSRDHFLSSCSSRDRPLSGDELMLQQDTTLSHQPTRAAGRQASTPLTGATHTACSLESRRVDGGGGGGGGSSVDSFEGKAMTMPECADMGRPHDCQNRRRRLRSSVPASSSSCAMFPRTSLRLQEINDLMSRSGVLIQHHT